jgi:hypothetical protein
MRAKEAHGTAKNEKKAVIGHETDGCGISKKNLIYLSKILHEHHSPVSETEFPVGLQRVYPGCYVV